MPLPVLQPGSIEARFRRLETQIAAMETAASIGAARTKGGTTFWADVAGADQITVGQQADGSYAIKVGAITITATGPNAGKLLGVVAATLAGLQVNGNINATGTIGASGQINGSADVVVAGRVVTAGLNTGDRNFKFIKTSSTRLDINTT